MPDSKAHASGDKYKNKFLLSIKIVVWQRKQRCSSDASLGTSSVQESVIVRNRQKGELLVCYRNHFSTNLKIVELQRCDIGVNATIRYKASTEAISQEGNTY